jgi:hypothetical protein
MPNPQGWCAPPRPTAHWRSCWRGWAGGSSASTHRARSPPPAHPGLGWRRCWPAARRRCRSPGGAAGGCGRPQPGHPVPTGAGLGRAADGPWSGPGRSGRRRLARHPPGRWHALVLAAHRPPALALRCPGGPAGGRAGQPGSAQAAPAALPGRLVGGPHPGPAGPDRAGRPAAAAAAPGPLAGQRPPCRPAAPPRGDQRPGAGLCGPPRPPDGVARQRRQSPPPSRTAAWRSSSTPAITPSWRSPTASPPSWPASSPRSASATPLAAAEVSVPACSPPSQPGRSASTRSPLHPASPTADHEHPHEQLPPHPGRGGSDRLGA